MILIMPYGRPSTYSVAAILKGILCLGFISAHVAHAESTGWHSVGGDLTTRWAKQINPSAPLPEYPRPQMVRARWQNLNGLWQYAITAKEAPQPKSYEGDILVPYPIESAISGVKKQLHPDQSLWYHRTIRQPVRQIGERVLLHFGAVDFEATVYVNGQNVGGHTGGYQSFTIDITDALKNGNNRLDVKVWDPTDEGPNPHGKQTLKPRSIWYTATSGIWQTVWLETVPSTYIESLVLTPDIDHGVLRIEVRSNANAKDEISVASAAARSVIQGRAGTELFLPISDARLWSPNDPYLYDLEVSLLKNGEVVDRVGSYFGMRKIEVRKDGLGQERIFLNNLYTYNAGVLDQGYWPDGLYTAPTDDALKSDIQVIKASGFNTIRKHIKIEPARWYYHCDTLGIMVWQDMVQPASDLDGHAPPTPAARAQFEKELRENLELLHNFPCISTWVLFNEGWGAYDQARLEDLVKRLDPSRLVNGHSGATSLVKGETVYLLGSVGVVSDMVDLHSYPMPGSIKLRPGQGKAVCLGEFGGLGTTIDGHVWRKGQGFGYFKCSPSQLPQEYAKLIEQLKPLEMRGLTASIYTQPFDVEIEENGLMTYDREIGKIPPVELMKLNRALVDEPVAVEANGSIVRRQFGQHVQDKPIELYTLRNSRGMQVRITTYGGIITQLTAPDRNGVYADVVLGFETLSEYVKDSPYFGALIGRYGNRIAKGNLTLDGHDYKLATNNGPNSLHGGNVGFDKVIWQMKRAAVTSEGPQLTLHYLSCDGEEGYPGNLDLTVVYTLTEDNALRLDYQATTDRTTVLNLTQHSYFNLRGHGDILGHVMQIDADRFTPVDATLIPTGELRFVEGTPFDFRRPTAIGARIEEPDEQLKFGGGYDHNWVFSKRAGELGVLAKVYDPETGRVLEVSSTEPGLQFYSGNFLDGSFVGKGGWWSYKFRNGFCLEPQHFPDSPNHENFPSTVLKVGQVFSSSIVYRFTAQK